MPKWFLRILETVEEMHAVEDLQRLVWPEDETVIVPAHLLLAAAHNGGMVIGAYLSEGELTKPDFVDERLPGARQRPSVEPPLIGFVFGFAGLYHTPDGPRLKHYSHMMGVLPDYRDLGLGFALKRAQWQMVRHQGIDRITWTYDPLLSRNAHLNIARLGAVCNLYHCNEYGKLQDGLNVGLPSDRFQVDWWVYSRRVNRRLSKSARSPLTLAHFLTAGVEILNPAQFSRGWPYPCSSVSMPAVPKEKNEIETVQDQASVVLVEIPSDFMALKTTDASLALEWRMHSRSLFENLFNLGYLVTDFIFLPGELSRSFYALSYGESTL